MPSKRFRQTVAEVPTEAPPPVVVDASVWVARYLIHDDFHARSAAWFRMQRRAGRVFVAPTLLLPELAGSVARVLNDTTLGLRAARSVRQLHHVQFVPLDAALAAQTFQIAAQLRLRGAHAVYAALARRLSLQLVSWDKEQIARAGAVEP